MNVIRWMKTVPKVKIHKWKKKFNVKTLTGSRFSEKSPNIFPTYVRILYNLKNKNNVTFYDSYYIFNPVKPYWSVKSNVYIAQ
jgi:hypothetical protein